MKNIEIERKFLVDKSLLELLKKEHIPYQKKSLKQYYTKIDSQETSRFRKADKTYFHTRKSGRGFKRKEIEKEISKEEFDANKILMKGYMVEKKRYVFRLDNKVYEFDIFDAPVDDLAYLELEFEDEEAYHAYKVDPLLAPYIIQDVSDDFRYTNASLSLFKLPKEKEMDGDGAIKPHFKSGDVLRVVLLKYLENLMHYREKMIDAYEDEDLHQFRINLRKSRAIVGKLGGVFAQESLEEHAKNLRAIGNSTNRKRDLDVFIQAFEARFRGEIHSELQYFYHDISQQRIREERILQDFLKSEELERHLQAWKGFLEDTENSSKIADTPIALFLEERVEGILSSIEKKLHKYEKEKKEAHLHKVRISFKKLRYILESFDMLFRKSRIKDLLKRVKRLQNDLGDFNDLCVQYAFVEDYLEKHQLVRESEQVFSHFLAQREKEKVQIQKKIEADIEKSIDIEILKKDLEVKFL